MQRLRRTLLRLPPLLPPLPPQRQHRGRERISIKLRQGENQGLDIHESILELCRERNWTLYKLAHESGISEATVYGWFSENHFTPSRSSIEDICRAFEISVAAFYNDIDIDKLTPQQVELLTLFEKVPDNKKSAVLEIIRTLSK